MLLDCIVDCVGVEAMATYSQGSVTKRRGKWAGMIWKTDTTGKRSRLSKALKEADGSEIPCDPKTNRGRNRAIAALTRWRGELLAAEAEDEAAEARSASLSGVTLGEYLNAYLNGLKASHSVERSTMTAYRASARKVAEALGSVAVTELRREQVQEWESRLLNVDGLSPRSVTKHHRLLSQALKAVVENGQLAANPCEGVRLPKRHREQPHAMTKDAANELLGTLAAMPQRRAVAAARIALTSGLRVGEVCALTWADVDADTGVLRVNKAVGMGGGGAYVKAPKNPYSVRDVPLTSQLTEALDSALALLTADEDNAISKAQDAGYYVSRAAAFASDLEAVGENLNNAAFQLSDAAETLRDFRDSLDFSPEEYDSLETRISLLSKLQRKYSRDEDGLIQHLAECREKLDNIQYADERSAKLQKQLKEAEGLCRKKAAKLTISSAVPVVGSMVADASETLLVSASVLRGGLGVFGLLGVLAVSVLPFLETGCQYLMLKLTAAAAGAAGEKELSALIGAMAGAMGLLTGLVGACAAVLMVACVCFMKVSVI